MGGSTCRNVSRLLKTESCRGGSTCRNDILFLPRPRIAKVGQHAGINHYSRWVNMQEWWVIINRNDGSTCAGIYTGMPLSEQHLYGSSRLGMISGASTIAGTSQFLDNLGSGIIYTFTRGKKLFELSNHLGNVWVTVSDKKYGTPVSGVPSQVSYYTADVKIAQDYYPFGMEMPGRQYNSTTYAYTFNGKRDDKDAEYGWQDYGMREYDKGTARFISIDPLISKYPMLTPYQFSSNSPVANLDLDGEESRYYRTELFTFTGQDNKPLINPTSITIEDKGREVQVLGMFHAGNGPLDAGNLIDIYSTNTKVSNGNVVRATEYLGYIYIPSTKYDKLESSRGGFYLTSSMGGYNHSDGDLPEGEGTQISLDFLVKLIGGFPSNESVIRI
jgi:RHS repeat-associated protein